MNLTPSQLLVWRGYWFKDTPLQYPNYLFVIGDNFVRTGKGGQAIIRGHDNVDGIVTKKSPRLSTDAYLTDADFEIAIAQIQEDINRIISKITFFDQYEKIVLSEGGYGNGLAKLYETSPLIYSYLNGILYGAFGFDNHQALLQQK